MHPTTPKNAARLENWKLQFGRAYGNIYEDERKRFADGDWIKTSPIVKQTTLYIETENTVYVLGTPAIEKDETIKMHELLQFFGYTHLPKHLQSVSKLFHDLAYLLNMLPDNVERTISLRKLLEAKDCAVRAVLFREA